MEPFPRIPEHNRVQSATLPRTTALGHAWKRRRNHICKDHGFEVLLGRWRPRLVTESVLDGNVEDRVLCHVLQTVLEALDRDVERCDVTRLDEVWLEVKSRCDPEEQTGRVCDWKRIQGQQSLPYIVLLHRHAPPSPVGLGVSASHSEDAVLQALPCDHACAGFSCVQPCGISAWISRAAFLTHVTHGSSPQVMAANGAAGLARRQACCFQGWLVTTRPRRLLGLERHVISSRA